MIKKIFCFALVFIVFFVPLFSEENQKSKKKDESSSSLQHEIVVTATRLETPAKEIASSITVITKEDLERTKKTTVLEALQDVLGVSSIQSGPTGAAASVFLRGANSEHTLVLMDGVELNDPISPSRSFDFAHLTFENIERIEILRGPQSTLFGSDALSGVVNIITEKGAGKPKITLTSAGGSYGTVTANSGISGSTGSVNYSLGTSYFRSEGLSAASSDYKGNKEKDGYKNLSFSGRLGYNPADNLTIDLIVRTFKTKTDIDNFGGEYGDDSNHTQNYNATFLKGQIRSLSLKNRWEKKLSLSFVSYDRRHENPIDSDHPYDSEEGFFESKLFSVGWQNNFFLHETNTLTLGIDYQQERGESEYHSNGIWGPYSSIFPLRQAHTTGIFFQEQIRVADQFFATAGIRFDNHSQFGSAVTYRIAPAFFIKKTDTKLKITYGTGFKSPSLYQLYAPGSFWGPIGNNKLNPETSTGWDSGIEQVFLQGKIICGVTYFLNSYKNLINFDYLQGFINIGKAESRGIELLANAQPAEKLLCQVTYTKTEAKDKDTNTYLLRRPRHKFTASINYHFMEKGHINLSFIHIGKRDDMDFSTMPSNQVILPSYSLLNTALSFDLKPHIQIFCRFDNIFNEKFELVKGYGTPGFSVYGGMKIHL